MDAKSGVKSRKKFNENLRSFAMTLHFLSPKAYEYVRDVFDCALNLN